MGDLVIPGLGSADSLGPVSIQELVRRIRVRLEDNPFEDTHSGAVNDTDTTTVLAVPDGTKYAKSVVIEWEDNTFERALVDSVAANNITVKRGHDGTTKAAHAAGARILKAPVWSGSVIREQILATIRGDLWPYLWRVLEDTIAPSSTTTTWYDLDSAAIDLISVSQLYGTGNRYVAQFGKRGGMPVIIDRNLPTALVASGTGLSFPAGFANSTNTVYVKARARVTSTTVEDGNVAEAIVWGAITRMFSDKDITEVAKSASGTGRAIRAASWYRANFELARENGHAHLMATAPPMPVWRR